MNNGIWGCASKGIYIYIYNVYIYIYYIYIYIIGPSSAAELRIPRTRGRLKLLSPIQYNVNIIYYNMILPNIMIWYDIIYYTIMYYTIL